MSVLDDGRVLAESMMQTTVLIRREGPKVRDPETGTMVPSWTDVYEGPARIRVSNALPREVDQAGQRVVDQSPTLSLPIAVTSVRMDDMGEVTANPPDPGIVGVRFRVVGPHAQTHSTARRLPIEVLTFA